MFEFNTEDERAVSPVIGVILMVAITVILAAVIGAFVLNLGSNVSENVQAGASVTGDSADDTITITYTSTQKDGTTLDIKIEGTDTGTDLTNVGASETYGTSESFITADADHQVVVTANNGDQSTVIIDKKVSL